MNAPDPVRPICFKAYDVRGRIGSELDADTAFRIGTAYARVMSPDCVVLGHDCRESSPALHDALARGLMAAGVDVLTIGLAGTEEVYFATHYLGAGGGIEVTASHNPIDYNGLKFVGPGSRPLSEEEFARIAALSMSGARHEDIATGRIETVDTRAAFADHVAGLVDAKAIGPVRIVVNAGHGVAGPAFDAIAQRLSDQGAQIEITRLYHEADGSFPAGIPNPLLPENRGATADAVRAACADIGIAWDGDFDRCFFFDASGAFVAGEYVVGLLAASFLESAPGSAIVHDPRVVWSTLSEVARGGGRAVAARTGHAHIKRAMRESGAIYGGEMSAHHYFRDFMCCDSGMIPWLKVLELMGRTGRSLGDLVGEMARQFPSSGERNFKVADPIKTMERIRAKLEPEATSIEELDGLSLSFADWRMNIRTSSTEPLLRLNVESRRCRNTLDGALNRVLPMIKEFAA